MPWKKKPSLNWKLYCITTDKTQSGKPLEWLVEQTLLGGADVIQLRDKLASDEELLVLAKKILLITRRMGVPLILNDRIEVAVKSGADGVHLGQDDASFLCARQKMGEYALIGRSTHTRVQAETAQREGFDYIGVGPIYSTPTKPSYEPVGLDLLRYAAKTLTIPFVAIGGIDAKNVNTVLSAGAKTIAVVRAVMGMADPRKEAEKLCRLLG